MLDTKYELKYDLKFLEIFISNSCTILQNTKIERGDYLFFFMYLCIKIIVGNKTSIKRPFYCGSNLCSFYIRKYSNLCSFYIRKRCWRLKFFVQNGITFFHLVKRAYVWLYMLFYFYFLRIFFFFFGKEIFFSYF